MALARVRAGARAGQRLHHLDYGNKAGPGPDLVLDARLSRAQDLQTGLGRVLDSAPRLNQPNPSTDRDVDAFIASLPSAHFLHDGLDDSWAGEFSVLFPELGSPSLSRDDENGGTSAGAYLSATWNPVDTTVHDMHTPCRAFGSSERTGPHHSCGPKTPGSRELGSHSDPVDRPLDDPIEATTLLKLFARVTQPPAAILIGGTERWRRLQQYLCKLSEQSSPVHNALLCVVETLEIEAIKQQGQLQDAIQKRIYSRHAEACKEIQAQLLRHGHLKFRQREQLLAAIFLLAWFEVIRDQDTGTGLFPRDLADKVIIGGVTWTRYSQQLLSWLNTLDSKATHLGGDHLLTPDTLEVVSHYPTQITSLPEHRDESNPDGRDDLDGDISDLSPKSSQYSIRDVDGPTVANVGEIKQMMLNAVIQPALDWYLTGQSYCRRIGAHDKHHRQRFTTDDEYEVIVASKQIEAELFELWDYRPAVVSLDAEHLAQVVTLDVALRLQEIFSVYLASFWILFLYLHRVSWWTLPHSAVARRSLDEVWQHLHRAYGEEVNDKLQKIVHPALLWPLFMFGCECPDEGRRSWAIEQLEALGGAKPVVDVLSSEPNGLPQFKLSAGATRNAKRAALLLRELIKEQDRRQARVDDRDLSMKLFGCYFAIV